MLAPDAVLCLDAGLVQTGLAGNVVCFFKNRQLACWDVATEQLLPGHPCDIGMLFPGLLEARPDRGLRGALRVPEWGDNIYFLFEGDTEFVVWDTTRRTLDDSRIGIDKVLPSALTDGGTTFLTARLADRRPVIYGFKELDYTQWSVGSAPPAREDAGFPRKIADGWKDGLVLAPRAGVYVDWVNRSTAHSNRKIYFFMGDLYLRWDVPSNTRNYRLDIIAGWKGWPVFG